MYIYLKVNASETLASCQVHNYPASTSITGSPFSGASLSNLGNGLWKINVGAATGNWTVDGFNAAAEPLATGFASSRYVDENGDALVTQFAPWLTPSIIAPLGVSGSSSTIEFFVGETPATTRQCIDANGNAVTLTGLTLELVIEDRVGADMQVIPNASITVAGSEFTFTPTSSVTALPKIWNWSLRNTANDKVLMHGLMPINPVAGEGTPIQHVWDGGTIT